MATFTEACASRCAGLTLGSDGIDATTAREVRVAELTDSHATNPPPTSIAAAPAATARRGRPRLGEADSTAGGTGAATAS
jgi:hypothetical protein